MGTNYKQLEEKWDNLSEQNKRLVVELYIKLNPTIKQQINEDRWWNTVFDIVGILDPTGIVDFVNGLDYIRQGDYLFGFLSMVSAIPYVGDAVAKPLIAGMKIGKGTTKSLKAALNLAKAGKSEAAIAKIAEVSKTGGVAGKFVDAVTKWGDKLIAMINAVPGGRITKGLKNTLIEWVNLFQQGVKQSKLITTTSANLVKNMKSLSKAEQVKALEDLVKLSKNTGLFRGYKAVNPSFWSKAVVGGSPRVWELFTRSQRSTRSLMRRTKWYLGLLDKMGIGNFVGPEELESKYGKDEIIRQIEEYNKTPEANKYWLEDFGGGKPTETNIMTGQEIFKPTQQTTKDPVLQAFDIFF